MREEHYGDRKEVHRFVLSVVAMRVSNPDPFALWNQSLRHSPNSNRLC
jgi:hypothetical protein